MSYLLRIILLSVIMLTACSSTVTLEPTNTPQPTATTEPTKTSTPPPTVTSTPTKAPSPIFKLGDIETLVVSSGFTVSVPFPLQYQSEKNIVLIGTEDKSFTASFTSEPYDGTQPLIEVIDQYLTSFEERGWQFTKGDATDIVVDGIKGIAIDLAGTAGDITFEGQAIAVSSISDLVLFGFGISITDRNDWVNSGKPTLDGLLDRIKFSNDDAACSMSTDQTYGYTEANPIQLGGDVFGGPSRERAYLDHLRGPNGEVLSYEREGSIPTDTGILDGYRITGAGIDVTLYLDVYNYTPPQAPVGFTCDGAFPLANP